MAETLAGLGMIEAFVGYLGADKRDLARRYLLEARKLIQNQSDLIRQLEAASALAESLPGGEPEGAEQSDLPF